MTGKNSWRRRIPPILLAVATGGPVPAGRSDLALARGIQRHSDLLLTLPRAPVWEYDLLT